MSKKMYFFLIIIFLCNFPVSCEKFLLNNVEVIIKDIKDNRFSNNHSEGILVKPVIINVGSDSFILMPEKPIEFNKNEKFIISAFLNEDIVISASGNELILGKGTKILFSKLFSGDIYLQSANLSENQPINIGNYQLLCKKANKDFEYTISFNSKMQIVSIVLNNNQEFTINDRNYIFADSSMLSFGSDNILSGVLFQEIQIDINDNTFIVKDSRSHIPTIHFYMSGQIKSLLLAKPHELTLNSEEFILQENRLVKFYQDGKIQEIVLGKTSRIKIDNRYKNVKEGKKIIFDDKGNVHTIK